LGQRGADPALSVGIAEGIVEVARLIGSGVEDDWLGRRFGLACQRP
jgi:hypothetical protein